MNYEINVCRSVEQLNEIKWDAIASISLLKIETLRSVEGLSLSKDAYYIEIFKGEELIAIAVFYGQYDSLYASLDESLYGFLSLFIKPLLGMNPSLVCHFPYSPFYKMFDIKEGFNKHEIFELLKNELKKLANSKGYKSYGFMGIEEESFLKNSSDLYQLFAGFKTRIEVKGKTINEHIYQIENSSKRKTFKKDLRHLEMIPFRIETIKKLDHYEKSIIDILNMNFDKYFGDGNGKGVITNEYVKALDEKSNSISFFIGKLNDEIVSASMIIEDNSRIIGLRIGQKETKGLGYPFFDLAIHQPIRYAIENSKKYIELGTGNYEYKIRRGATLSSCYNLIKSTNRFKNLYLQYVIAILNKRKRYKHMSRALGGKIENEI